MEAVTRSVQKQLGDHLIEIDGDLITVLSSGAWSVEELDQLIQMWEELSATHGRIFYIGDFSSGLNMSADGRRRLVAWARKNEFTAAAVVVSSLPVRTMITLILRAAQLLNPRSSLPMFYSTIAEARRYIAEKRAAHPARSRERGT